LLLSIAGVVYVSISGYRGVVSTDRLRFWAILVGVGAIYFFIVHSVWTNGATFTDEFLSARMLSIGPAPLALTSLVVLLALYQFCVMDMWERCIAIAKSHDFTTIKSGQADAGQVDGGQADAVQAGASQASVVTGIRRMIAWSCVPFVFLFGAWYGIGLLALGQHWADDPNQIVPLLLSRLDRFAASGLLGAGTETLIILAFTAAALSTIDGFIIAAVQTVVCDWFPSFTKSKREWNQLDDSTASVWLVWARVLVLLVGVAAVLVAFLSFGVMSFWVGMYSLMLSFFPAVFLRVARPSFSRPHGQVSASILLGASFALAAAILGTFVFPTQAYLTILPPFLAVAVSALVLLPNLGTPGISLKHWMILGIGTLCGVFMWLAPQVAPNRYPRERIHDSAAFPPATGRAGAAPIAAGDST